MNLKFIDRVIKANEDTFSEEDVNRLKYFYGLWDDMDRWSKGPTTAEKHYAVPSAEELEEAWICRSPCVFVCPSENPEKSFCGDML